MNNKLKNIPITNKELWIYNTYYCIIKHLNGAFEEYDTFAKHPNRQLHRYWHYNDINLLEGIHIEYNL